MNINIFTYMPSNNKISGYIELCINTWKKYLSESAIHILNDNDLSLFYKKRIYDEKFFKNFSKQQHLEAFKCYILNENSGLWLNPDTIINGNTFQELLDSSNADITIFNNKTNTIFVKKNSDILSFWQNYIKEKINKYNDIHKEQDVLKRNIAKIQNWGILTEDFFEKYSSNKSEINNITDFITFPEQEKYKASNILSAEKYLDFYFNNTFDLTPYPLIFLNDSWTPEGVKKMSSLEFLKLNNTLSNFFKK